MNCLVTAGPTHEPLDDVRRLTNASTGQLGCELANYLANRGHQVTLLRGTGATYPGPPLAQHLETFSTTADLRDRLQRHAGPRVQAVFHAAAVSDFAFGKIWSRAADGTLTPRQSAKLPSRAGVYLVELAPTPKLIASLRDWFPQARLVGWKYEVVGPRPAAVAQAEQQLVAYTTDACVLNGPAYGAGFALVTGPGQCLHLPDAAALYAALVQRIQT